MDGKDPCAEWRTAQRTGTGAVKSMLEALHYLALWRGLKRSHAKTLSLALRRALLAMAADDLKSVPAESLYESDVRAVRVSLIHMHMHIRTARAGLTVRVVVCQLQLSIQQFALAAYKQSDVKPLPAPWSGVLRESTEVIDTLQRSMSAVARQIDTTYPQSGDLVSTSVVVSGSNQNTATEGLNSWCPPRLNFTSLTGAWYPLPWFEHLRNTGVFYFVVVFARR